MLWTLLFVGLVATTSALNLPGVPSAFTESDEVLSAISDDIARKFSKEYISFMKTGVESAALRQISQQLAKSHSQKDIFTKNVAELSAVDQFFTCTTCRAVVNVVVEMFISPEGELNGPNATEDTKNVMIEICLRLNIQTAEVCAGLFDLNWPIFEHLLHNSVADSRSVCGTLPMNICKVKQEQFNWSLDIDNTGAPITGPKSEIPAKSDNDLSVIHLTDIHYDPDYVVGSLAECDEPLCCQHQKAEYEGTSKAAGYWSDYRVCDSPLHMIKDTLDHINKNHEKIDYIYQTGDIVPHTVWSTTKEGNKAMVTEINDLLAAKFPEIPIYSCVGNHEPHPTNIFSPIDAPEELNVKWLYEHMYQSWSKWLPASTKDTILKGGYYTVSPKPGFRIVALNSMDCYLTNWWLFNNGNMGIDQLKWLHDTLLSAEKAGEHVHILSHIPSGDVDCWTVWAREYNRIIERFSNTVSGIFNGHTHKDEMNLHYSTNGHAVAISWNGGSLASFTYKNPNYVKYQVESASMQVVDQESWIFNLTEANEHAEHRSPLWEKEFQFSTEFTSDLSPAGIHDLLNEMADNPDLLRKYWRFKMTSADPKLETGCNNKCLKSTICRLATTNYDNKIQCNELKAKLQDALDKEVPVTDKPTTEKPTTEKPGGDGAASLIALKITTIIGLIMFVKYLF